MKKVFISLTVLFAVSQFITAQSVNSFISDFAQSEGVETQNIDSQTLAQVKAAALDSTVVDSIDDEDLGQLDKLKNIEVLSCETPSDALTAKFVNFIENFTEDADYDVLIKIADGDEKALILTSKKQAAEKMMIVFGVDSDGLAIVKISGDVNLNDIMNGKDVKF